MNTENRQGILILGIETSCDETAAALTLDGSTVLSNVILSQIDVHRIYGGVVPEIASRKHVENISFVVEEALRIAGVSKREIGAVAVTCGPGLVGALLVGLSFGKALSYALKKPLIGVNHIEGHVCANYLDNENFQPPFICLVASGGHTHLLEVKAYGEYEVLGRTRDDAAGEAFDKVARSLGLSYPGGPAIDVLAAKGNPSAISLPRAEISGSPYDFSFSGLKSAVLNVLQKMKAADTIGAVDAIGAAGGLPVEDIAASFQQAVVDVLVEKTIR
ncbi:MAG: tRNA (adenosine(37)-N6)-threonylcarbamoyltransferase complex transferase subunit TsaD, partial [Clostridiales bacterium]|nr:tRNA (adenosine(37)-N6)-threonylcarbamoyltransferase complex transferase subunit TsaD [Clostridiales bacterium]